MDVRRTQRVLPSNAPALTSTQTSDLEDSLESSLAVICPDYNNNHECNLCGRHHIYSNCSQSNHGAFECKAVARHAISEDNVLAGSQACLGAESELEHKSKPIAPSIFTEPPYHTAQANLRQQRIGRPTKFRIQRNRYHKPSLYYPWEKESQSYRQYREKIRQKSRQKKPGDKDKEVWPDNVEQAFQDEALRLFHKRGRTKQELHGKQSGGNEFIADHIRRMTGEEGRDFYGHPGRKKVSSHIQVLKGKLKDVHEWMFLVTPWPDKKGGPQYNKMLPKVNLDIELPPGSLYSDLTAYNAHAGPRLSSDDSQDPTIRRVEFTMKLAAVDEADSDPVKETLHTFTRIQSEMGSAPRPLEQIARWQMLFPALANDYALGYTAPIFLFNASLDLLKGIPTSHGTKNLPKKLPISLNIDFTQGARYYDWRSINRYHELGGTSRYFEKPLQEGGTLSDVDALDTSASIDAKLQVPFNSGLWAELFHNINRRREEKSRKSLISNDPEILAEEDADIRRYIEELSLMQELWATPRVGEAKSQCMAILLWTFSQTRDEAPTTSWRRIIRPSSAPRMQPLPSSSMGPSFEVDTTLQDSQTFPYTGHCDFEKNSIFADVPERILAGSLSEGSSRTSTPHADFESYPSSNSASFPSTTSKSTHSSNVSQQNSFDSKSSVHSSMIPLDSQDSSYSTHQTDFVAHHFPCNTQDAIFESQESFYGPGPLYPVYEHQNLDDSTLVGIEEHSQSNSFKVSYTDAPDFVRDYEAPLLAPRAQVMPQHHFLQLQDYDNLDPHLDNGSDPQEQDERVEDYSLREQQNLQDEPHQHLQQDPLLLLEQYALEQWPEGTYQRAIHPNIALDHAFFDTDMQIGETQEAGFAQLLQRAHTIAEIEERAGSVRDRVEGRVELLE